MWRWHARKFCEFNDLDWEPTSKDDVCPPNEFFNNDNMSDFFIELFHVRGKPSIQQAHKWLNHVLAQNKRPPVNKMHHQHYASVLDVLRGMTKEDKWKSHKSKGAESFTKEVVRKIFEAQLVDPKTQELSLVRLRNKALAILMIGNGWHVKEVLRLRDDGVEDFPNYTDRDGKIRPKMVFRGQKAKEPVLTKNTVGCGCRGGHTAINTNCFYNVLSWYRKKKEQSDAEFVEKKMCKMAQSQRDTHLNEDGTLETRRFFRSHPTKKDKFNYPHRNMGRGAINDVFEFWNVELGENGDKMVPGEKLTTNQARKTFATFGYRHTAHKTRAVLFHFPWEALPEPVCRGNHFRQEVCLPVHLERPRGGESHSSHHEPMESGPSPADSRELDARRARDDQSPGNSNTRPIHQKISAQIRELQIQQMLVLHRNRGARRMKKSARVSCN